MTDYNTMTQLKMKTRHFDELDGSVRQTVINPKYVGKKNIPSRLLTKDYIVITEDSDEVDDFHNILAILNIKKEELPTISKKYYKKEFINKNWSTIWEHLSKYYTENTEEELEYLIEMESYVAEEDWELDSLEEFSSNRSSVVNGNFFSFPDVRFFEDYENAFASKPVPALVFEVLFCGNTPSFFFHNFNHKVKGNTSYLSALFNVNDIDKHFDTTEKYSYVHVDEIELYKEKYSNDVDEIEPNIIFAFG